MSLTLYFHPLSSFCQKALIALYENDTPFTPHIVDLGDEAQRASLVKLWPMVWREGPRRAGMPGPLPPWA